MSIFNLPEGVELDIKIYLAGSIKGQEIETVLTLGGLTAFSNDLKDELSVDAVVKSNGLDKLGTDWRIMTREEIKDYRKRQDDDERGGLYSVGVDLD